MRILLTDGSLQESFWVRTWRISAGKLFLFGHRRRQAIPLDKIQEVWP